MTAVEMLELNENAHQIFELSKKLAKASCDARTNYWDFPNVPLKSSFEDIIQEMDSRLMNIKRVVGIDNGEDNA